MDHEFKLPQEVPKDPRTRPSNIVTSSATDIRLRRLKWEYCSFVLGLTENGDHTTKPKPIEIDTSLTQSPDDSSECSNPTPNSPEAEEFFFKFANKRSSAVVIRSLQKPSLLSESWWKMHKLLYKSEPSGRSCGGRRKKILLPKPTDLENYLMRIHEVVRITSDAAYVEDQCRRLLSNMIRKVSFLSEDVSERNL